MFHHTSYATSYSKTCKVSDSDKTAQGNSSVGSSSKNVGIFIPKTSKSSVNEVLERDFSFTQVQNFLGLKSFKGFEILDNLSTSLSENPVILGSSKDNPVKGELVLKDNNEELARVAKLLGEKPPNSSFHLELVNGKAQYSPGWVNKFRFLTVDLPLAYALLYPKIREKHLDIDNGEGVSYKKLYAILYKMCERADFTTGCNSIISREILATEISQDEKLETAIKERTITRAWLVLRLMGLLTESFRGRPLSNLERKTLQENDIAIKGFASVYNLHPNYTLTKSLIGNLLNSKEFFNNYLKLATHLANLINTKSFSYLLINKRNIKYKKKRLKPNGFNLEPPNGVSSNNKSIKSLQNRKSLSKTAKLASSWLSNPNTPTIFRKAVKKYNPVKNKASYSVNNYYPILENAALNEWTGKDINDLIDYWLPENLPSPTLKQVKAGIPDLVRKQSRKEWLLENSYSPIKLLQEIMESWNDYSTTPAEQHAIETAAANDKYDRSREEFMKEIRRPKKKATKNQIRDIRKKYGV